MKIKYADVPKMETLQKLISVSFDSPKKNLAVYKFYMEMSKHASYIENEREKMIKKHGELDKDNPCLYTVKPGTESMQRFMEEWNSLMNMDIEEEVNQLPISEVDFSDDCSYSPEKSEWLSPRDIGAVLRFCK